MKFKDVMRTSVKPNAPSSANLHYTQPRSAKFQTRDKKMYQLRVERVERAPDRCWWSLGEAGQW